MAAAAAEAVIVSTCNRLEVYAVTRRSASHVWRQTCLPHMHRHLHANACEQMRCVHGRAAIEHILRVSGGLEGSILDECRIVEQLSSALNLARECGTAGQVLDHLFGHAIQTGERVRARNGYHKPCVGRAAANLWMALRPDLGRHNVLIVGAGNVAEHTGLILREYGAQQLAIINRTAAHGAALARELKTRTFPWHQMRTALAWADVVIAATAAMHPVLDVDDLAAILPQRLGRPLILFDLGLPRNIQPAVDAMQTVRRFDLDDIQRAAADASPPPSVRPEIEMLVNTSAATFCAWLSEHSGQ